MVFHPPSWAPTIPLESIPDSIPVCDFLLNEEHGRAPYSTSKSPFIWGGVGGGFSATEVRQRVDYLARSLAHELGWHPNQRTEWDKTVNIFSVNTIDFLPLGWAVHRLSGVASLSNAACSADELTHQLRASKVSAIFTCIPLLETALKAASNCGIPRSRVYLLDIPGDKGNSAFTTVNQLIAKGSKLGELEQLRWEKGQGARQCAYLCFSSGTSGLPKGVTVSHVNMISEVLLFKLYESHTRTEAQRDTVLGLLPYSHIYGLSVFNAAVYRGESIAVLPKFELEAFLRAIQINQINRLYVVPPIIVTMLKNESLMKKYDLSSVREVMTGAAPLGLETAEELSRSHPTWSILQAYGLTETTAVATQTSPHDVLFGSSGCLLPLLQARLVSTEGVEITAYDTPGELLLKGPTIVPGYLNNEAANKETFQDGWLRTGDEAIIKKSPKGEEHIFIVDRIKELIKVKAFQVAPAELEAHILTHPGVADTAVIGVDDDASGEVPKAFVVRASGVAMSDQELTRDIQEHVKTNKAHYKWLNGGVEFLDIIPKSPSGKILRRHLRDRERALRRRKASKI